MLTADVDYNFVDQNGFGWASTVGKVTVSLEIGDKAGTLRISGTRRWVDGRVTGNPGGPGMDTSNKWEGKADATYPLRDVARASGAITFKLDPVHDKLTGSCAPVKVPALASPVLYECTITGFSWQTIASLPELHHPIILDADPTAKLRIVNTMLGKAKPAFGMRTVTEVKRTK